MKGETTLFGRPEPVSLYLSILLCSQLLHLKLRISYGIQLRSRISDLHLITPIINTPL